MPLDLFYDKVQDRGQKIVSFEDKIQYQSDEVVMKFILQLIKFSIKITRFWHFDFENCIFLQLYAKK